MSRFHSHYDRELNYRNLERLKGEYGMQERRRNALRSQAQLLREAISYDICVKADVVRSSPRFAVPFVLAVVDMHDLH